MNIKNNGGFTMPGETGYEKLTLSLAKKWGADAIRDSDGTKLSKEITDSGFEIYSTLCLVRSDNKWAKANMDKLQQNYLMSFPVVAKKDAVEIDILKGYFKQQFVINAKDEPKIYWQVFDRTTGEEVPKEKWRFNEESETVSIKNIAPWHKYTVNFLVYRIWEEISMYNHITNDWGDREHLMSIEPIYPESQKQILNFLEKWLKEHPDTDVVRLTSMFYNFTWFWGDNTDLRYIYSDWGSYNFTVNPLSLKFFKEIKGYAMTSEDFVNAGEYNSTHNVPSERYRDWMDFINEFVVTFGKKCIDIVHKYGKKAYVFYDDHWIGVEPQGERFPEFGFDGVIKCVFNAFEARLCANVKGVKMHELRLHPYLFPTGLSGEPTFKEGGNPKLDAQRFWIKIRRALLRKGVDRIGLGGYLHLTKGFSDFIDYVEELTDEFRTINALHKQGSPYNAPCKVGILTAWGKLRSWSTSGHYHEHPEVELINILESLAGLLFEVEFLSFDKILSGGIPDDIDVIINAGKKDSAWSGGANWGNPSITELITKWVAQGNAFIGVGEPSAYEKQGQYFAMSHILGVEREVGKTICKNKYEHNVKESHFITEDLADEINFGNDTDGIFSLGKGTEVLAQKEGSLQIAAKQFEKGRSVYLSGYKFDSQNTRLLHRAICWAANKEKEYSIWSCSNPEMECAYFSESGKLIVINNSGEKQITSIINNSNGKIKVKLLEYQLKIIDTV